MIALSKTSLRAAAAVTLGSAIAFSVSPSRAEGVFADYAGNWSGGGTITIAHDNTTSNERIRCKGTYTVDGGGSSTLHLALRCASDSYRFDLTSNVRASGSQLTGDWSEASRGVAGTLDGRVAGGNITARVETNGYVATFNVTTRGGKQSVAITSPGDLRAVNIALSRN